MSRFVDQLQRTGANSPRGMTTGEPGDPVRRGWPEVHATARRMAAELQRGGGPTGVLVPGTAVALLAAQPSEIAPTAQAVWLAGGSVTMLHQPTARTDLAAWAEDTVRVLEMIGAKLVLLGPPFDRVADVLTERGIAVRTIAELDTGSSVGEVVVHPADEDDVALLQLTSGSTAHPKAVRITHGNLWANATAMLRASALHPERDVMISWLPLFHDMGMVGFLTLPMTFGIELVTVTPLDFLSRPLLWAELISRYGGTVTAAPNFAYAVLARQLARAEPGSLDLSSMRFALNGAEPIDPQAAAAFTDAGARFGLRGESVVAAYGMAETVLGVSFAPRDVGLQVDVIDAEQLEAQRRAAPVPDAADRPVRRFPLLGPPLPGIEARVVDDDGRMLGDRDVGVIQLRGPSVTGGYLTVDGPVSTQDAEGWLDTGDEGYLVDGAVVVCGRRKDVIIMGGRNIYPTDIERAAAEVADVRAGNTVAVRLPADGGSAGRRRESFLVVVESRRAGDPAAEDSIRKEVIGKVVSAVGVRPAEVVVLPPTSLPKTPSGKLRRAATADQIAEMDPRRAGGARPNREKDPRRAPGARPNRGSRG